MYKEYAATKIRLKLKTGFGPRPRPPRVIPPPPACRVNGTDERMADPIVDDEQTYSRLQWLLGRRGIEARCRVHRDGGPVAGTPAPATLGGVHAARRQRARSDRAAAEARPAPPVLAMTAYGTIENAVEAMRRSTDYALKSTALADVVEQRGGRRSA